MNPISAFFGKEKQQRMGPRTVGNVCRREVPANDSASTRSQLRRSSLNVLISMMSEASECKENNYSNVVHDDGYQFGCNKEFGKLLSASTMVDDMGTDEGIKTYGYAQVTQDPAMYYGGYEAGYDEMEERGATSDPIAEATDLQNKNDADTRITDANSLQPKFLLVVSVLMYDHLFIRDWYNILGT
ncbi:hypothetical protein Tco_0530466 [Tanacetum coccineum]